MISFKPRYFERVSQHWLSHQFSNTAGAVNLV